MKFEAATSLPGDVLSIEELDRNGGTVPLVVRKSFDFGKKRIYEAVDLLSRYLDGIKDNGFCEFLDADSQLVAKSSGGVLKRCVEVAAMFVKESRVLLNTLSNALDVYPASAGFGAAGPDL